jgi:hypothetical protein
MLHLTSRIYLRLANRSSAMLLTGFHPVWYSIIRYCCKNYISSVQHCYIIFSLTITYFRARHYSILKKLNFPPIVDGFYYFLPRVQAHVNTQPIQASIHMCLASWGGCFLSNAVGGLLCLASGTLLYNQHKQNRHKTHNTQQPTR